MRGAFCVWGEPQKQVGQTGRGHGRNESGASEGEKGRMTWGDRLEGLQEPGLHLQALWSLFPACRGAPGAPAAVTLDVRKGSRVAVSRMDWDGASVSPETLGRQMRLRETWWLVSGAGASGEKWLVLRRTWGWLMAWLLWEETSEEPGMSPRFWV